jgi:methyl-accepting chemotaxis protein
VEVSAGSTLAQQAGRTMAEVVDSVHKVSSIIGEISSASREQAQGIAAISEAVQAMDEDTRDSAAMVREAAAAAGALKGEAAHLAEVVAVFHLDKIDAPVRRPALLRG